MYYFLVETGDSWNSSLQMPGAYYSISKYLAETNSIMNGIQFHTWFVQAHLISSLLLNVFLKCKYLDETLFLFYFNIVICIASTLVPEFILFEQVGFRIC